MIRVELLRPGRGPARTWLPGALLVAVLLGGGLGGLYWIDRHYPLYRVWKQWTGQVEGGEMSGGAAVVEPVEEVQAQGAETVGESVPGAVGEPVAEAQIEGERAVPVEAPRDSVEAPPAPAARERAGADPPLGSGTRLAPSYSASCRWALGLYERVPAEIRLTSLTCNAAGEYVLEGLSPTHEDVEQFLDTLRQLPSRVSLSWWREGYLQVDQLYRYKFTFQGQFEQLPARELDLLSGEQAQVLFAKVGEWARQSGLGELALKKPIQVALEDGRVRQRQKLWASGSYQQIAAFLDRLKQVEAIASLGEVVVVPVGQEGALWERTRLYAALDVVLRSP